MDQAQQQLIVVGPDLAGRVRSRSCCSRRPAGSGDVVTVVLATLWGFVGGIFGLVSILLLTFYLLVESQGIFDLFVRLFPRRRSRSRRRGVSELRRREDQRVARRPDAARPDHRHHVGDRLLLLGVPYFFVLAVIAGIGEMIPMVGPLLSAIPAVAVALTVSPGLALGVAVFFMAQQLVENNVLVPKVMGERSA